MDVARGIAPGREEVWRTLAREIGATYVSGDFGQPDRVEARVGGRSVILDLFHASGSGAHLACARLRALGPGQLARVGNDRYRLVAGRVRVFEEADGLEPHTGGGLPAQNVFPFPTTLPSLVTGDAAFDRAFRVRSNDVTRAARLIAGAESAALRDYLLKEPHIGIEVSPPKRGAGAAFDFLVTCLVVEVVEDADRLLALFELMGETMQQLAAVGLLIDARSSP